MKVWFILGVSQPANIPDDAKIGDTFVITARAVISGIGTPGVNVSSETGPMEMIAGETEAEATISDIRLEAA